MRNTRYMLRALTVGLLLFFALCLPVFATEEYTISELSDTYSEFPSASLLSADYDEELESLADFLRGKINGFEENVIVYAEDYPHLTEQDVVGAIAKLQRVPDLFMLGGWSGKVSYKMLSYSQRKWNKVTLSVKYRYNKQEYDAEKAFFDKEIGEIAEMAEPSWSDLEKTLFLHDYIAKNFEYDRRNIKDSEKIRDVPAFLHNGYGVCEAYTMIVLSVMEQWGIPCTWCESISLVHVWNVVEIDGEWYHMDVTWDDPTRNIPILENFPEDIKHDYMLRSTNSMKSVDNGSHYQKNDWKYGEDVTCSSDKYDNYFWNDCNSPLLYIDGDWYCTIKNVGVCKWDGSESWYENLDGMENCQTGLVFYDGRLYSAESRQVLSYDMGTGELKIVDSQSDRNICFIGIQDTEITFVAWVIDDGRWEYYTLQIDSYTCVNDGGYRYQLEGNRLELYLDEGAIVIVAQYTADGRMIDCQIVQDVARTFVDLGEGLVFTIFSVTDTGAPRCVAQSA